MSNFTLRESAIEYLHRPVQVIYNYTLLILLDIMMQTYIYLFILWLSKLKVEQLCRMSI